MKKFFIIGAVLAFGLSACGFDPIPVPGMGWVYVQAKTIDMEELCGLFSGGGIALEDAVNDMLTAKVVEMPAIVTKEGTSSVKVFIETTLPNITLLPTDVTHWFLDGGVWKDLSGVFVYKVEQEGDNFIVTISDPNPAVGDIIKIIYKRKVIDLGFFDITMSHFSQFIEIVRILPEPIVPFSIHTKAEGLGWECNDPCYTGFRLEFLDPTDDDVKAAVEEYLTIIEVKKPSTVVLSNNVIELPNDIEELLSGLVTSITWGWKGGVAPGPAAQFAIITPALPALPYVSFPNTYEGDLELTATVTLGSGAVVPMDFVLKIKP